MHHGLTSLLASLAAWRDCQTSHSIGLKVMGSCRLPVSLIQAFLAPIPNLQVMVGCAFRPEVISVRFNGC
jgi:hypothetical protein